MAGDMAEELRPHNIAVVSLWPGAVKTEMFGNIMTEMGDEDRQGNGFTTAEMAQTVLEGETVEYSGKCVVALASEVADTLASSGRVLLTTDIGDKYSFKDIDGRKPPNFRSAKLALKFYHFDRLSALMPSCLKVPFPILAMATHKF